MPTRRRAELNVSYMAQLEQALNALSLEAPPDINRLAEELHAAAVDSINEERSRNGERGLLPYGWSVQLRFAELKERCRQSLQEDQT
jgi:hypothetical protein